MKVLSKADDIVDTGKVIKTGTRIISEVASSTALRKNLIAAGKVIPLFDNAAHHIVAGTSKYANEARKFLDKFGIGINDAVNGVFLPTVKGACESAYHPSLHNREYYKKINDMLRRAGCKEELIKILNSIAKQLIEGTFIK